MDLRSGQAFWLLQNGLIASYPSLKQDISCDVAVIGGGITGALVAYHLVEAGMDVVVVDRRDIGAGSTAASTALLQYEVDTPMTELIKKVGKPNAERSYLLCLEAIGKIERLVEKVGVDCSFQKKKSLYLATTKDDVDGLREEYAARKAIGIDLDFLERNDITSRFSFDAPAALLSYTAAQLDPYRFTFALLNRGMEKGLRVYDRTHITKFASEKNGVELQTERGNKIKARRVVFATGYEAQEQLKRKVVNLISTYALISEPTDSFVGWGEDQCLIWETARPYLYLRTTSDGRILMGGEDEPFQDDEKRDRLIPKKTEKLVKRFGDLFPQIDLEVAYSWAGTFGETKDGLAYIGSVKEYPSAYFALGYGGNGITYSMIAAELIRDLICGHPTPDAEIFSFER
jgi:glycine/D-amino acid oxidase-like deaminating enzyme